MGTPFYLITDLQNLTQVCFILYISIIVFDLNLDNYVLM